MSSTPGLPTEEFTAFTDLIEAQMLMGHTPANTRHDVQGTVVGYSWDEDAVRQALHVPLTTLWGERVLECELASAAHFSLYAAPITVNADGIEHVNEGWQDEPREKWGSLSLTPIAVLHLATTYGRPYVRWNESPAVLAHWRLVQQELAERLRQPLDDARWAAEWPERYHAWQARLRDLERDSNA